MSSMHLREGTSGAVAERDVEFAWFFRTEYESVVRTMYLIVHDSEQARDIAQDAFVQLFTRWRRISQYEGRRHGFFVSESAWRCGRSSASGSVRDWSAS